MKSLIIVAICTLLAFVTFAHSQTTYSKIFIPFNQSVNQARLHQAGIYPDHFKKFKDGIETVLDKNELEILSSNEIPFNTVIEDLTAHFQQINQLEMANPAIVSMIQQKTAATGFGFGSHANYYTPTEVATELANISNTYPNITSSVLTIGFTHENRPILAIKVSDNPGLDESANEPAVYFDAMHHAREPLSMMVNMYYLFWLVENYGTDPEATYLVNNREIYFVPIVNIDGYTYNITTEPNGGGLWRKTRKPNAGSTCIGTDPNRNYGADWGLVGASTNPCNNTYRGDFVYSEPETEAVKNFVQSINPLAAFSMHSYSEIYIESDFGLGIWDLLYADFSLDMCAEADFGYGLGPDLLYQSSGTTRAFLSSEGAVAYTPEIGSEFWEPASQIFYYLDRHFPNFKYMTKIAGDYPDIKSVNVNNQNLVAGAYNELQVEIINKGMSKNVNNATVAVVSNSSNITILNNNTTLSTLAARTSAYTDGNAIAFTINNNVNAGDEITIELAVSANGFEYERETQKWTIGEEFVLFESSGANGITGFNTTGTGELWDTTSVMQRSGAVCFTDSRIFAAENSITNYIALNNNVSLNNTENPRLEYWIAWGLSNLNTFSNNPANEDYANIQISENNGSWTDLATDITDVNNRYVLNNKWTKQIIDLSDYVNTDVKFRFKLSTSNSSKPDGVFVDDFRIVDYFTTPCAQIDFPTFTVVPVNCLNESNGSIKLLTPGNSGPYNYNWLNTNASNSPIVNNLSVGEYFVEITTIDSACFKIDTIVLADPIPALNYSIIVNEASFPNASDGSIFITTNGNESSILWNTGATATNLLNLQSGNYTVTITDINACIYTENIFVDEYDCAGLQIILNKENETSFNGNNGNITASTLNGIAPFTYLWSTGETTNSIDSLSPGNYSLTITGNDSCAITETFTIETFDCNTVYPNCKMVDVDDILFGGLIGNYPLPVCNVNINLDSLNNSVDIINDFNSTNVEVGEAFMSINPLVFYGNATIDEQEINNSQTNGDVGIKFGMLGAAISDSLMISYAFDKPVEEFYGSIYDIDGEDIVSIYAYKNGNPVNITVLTLGNNVNANGNSFENSLNTSVNASTYQNGNVRFLINQFDQLVFVMKQETGGSGGSFTFVPESGCTFCVNELITNGTNIIGITTDINGSQATICIDENLFSGVEYLTFSVIETCTNFTTTDSIEIRGNNFTNCPIPGCLNNLPFYINYDESLELDTDDDGVCDLLDVCNGFDDLFDLDGNQNSDYCEVCVLTRNITGTYQNNDNIYMPTENTIISNVEIKDNANILYEAGDSITLSNGFVVEQSAEFHAVIENCGVE